MAEPPLAGQTLAVTVVNWEGRLRLGTTVNGAVWSAGVERYRKLSGRHLTDMSAMVADGNLMVAATTSQSLHRVAVGTPTIAGHNGSPITRWISRSDPTCTSAEVAPLY
ncbi:hypothetical protein AB0I34_42095 [Kribbella sp. NPDC050281]|uniref:hypothetical protein n=1 Tax=Kribbella sp. NPDC050281 TaxID=3155515 RepID=UPI0033D3019F